jgi:cysteine synthase
MDREKDLRLKAVTAAVSRTANVLSQPDWREKIIDRYNELKNRVAYTNPGNNNDHYVYAKEEIFILQLILINFQ